MSNTRTYRWYTSHDTYPGRDDYYETERPDSEPMFQETKSGNIQKSLEPLGILDLVPNFENFKPLIDAYSTWWKKVEESWTNYEEESKKGSYLVSLHWILGRILQDPTSIGRSSSTS